MERPVFTPERAIGFIFVVWPLVFLIVATVIYFVFLKG